MSQHITRKELKHDRVAETLVHGAEAVVSHQGTIWLWAGVAALVLAAVFGWRFYSERQTLKASAALEDAMKVFNARIRMPGEPEEPGEITYVAETNKFEDAAKKFTDIVEKYGRTQPGAVARYYAGLSYELQGRNDEAEKWLRQSTSSSYSEVAALGKFQLAGVLSKQGKNEEAANLYKQLMANPTLFVPKPVVMLALAEHYAKTNPAEATKLYNELKTDFPNTAVAEEAEKQLEKLGPKT